MVSATENYLVQPYPRDPVSGPELETWTGGITEPVGTLNFAAEIGQKALAINQPMVLKEF